MHLKSSRVLVFFGLLVLLGALLAIAGCTSGSTATTTTTAGATTTTAAGNTTTTAGSTPTASAAGGPVTIDLVAQNMAFDKTTITVPAGAQVTINFDNKDSGISHNFAVYNNSSASQKIFAGNIITGPSTATYTFTAPANPGTYFFRCDPHPTIMTGQLVVQ